MPAIFPYLPTEKFYKIKYEKSFKLKNVDGKIKAVPFYRANKVLDREEVIPITQKRQIPPQFYKELGFSSKKEGEAYATANKIKLSHDKNISTEDRLLDYYSKIAQQQEIDSLPKNYIIDDDKFEKEVLMAKLGECPVYYKNSKKQWEDDGFIYLNVEEGGLVKLQHKILPLVLKQIIRSDDHNIPEDKFRELKQLDRDIKFGEIEERSDGLNDDDYIKGHIHIFCMLSFSADGLENRYFKVIYQGKVENMLDYVIQVTQEHYSDAIYFDKISYFYENESIVNNVPRNRLSFKGLKLRDNNDNLEITNNMFDIMKIAHTGKETCVIDYVNYLYPKLFISAKRHLNHQGASTLEDLFKFAGDAKLSIVAYDINGDVIDKIINNSQPKNIKKAHRCMFVLIHNGHLYPLNGKAKQSSYSKSNIVCIDNNDALSQIFLDEVNVNKKNPYGIELSSKNIKKDEHSPYEIVRYISTFCVGDTIYTNNSGLQKCKNILDILNIGDRFSPKLSKFNIMHTIYEAMNINALNNSMSIFPECSRFVKANYTLLNNNDEFKDAELYTRDCNKAYVHVLRDLPFLIKVNYITAKIHAVDPTAFNMDDIVDHYLYLVTPNHFSSILLPDKNLYAGYILKYVNKIIKKSKLENELNYTILEYIETERVDNWYAPIINKIIDLHETGKIDADTFKYICQSIVINVGKMEQDCTNTGVVNMYFHKFGVPEEIEDDKSCFPVDKSLKYYISYKESKKKNSLSNQKPICLQVKDGLRIHIFEELLYNDISGTMIKQIKTDSITSTKDFINKPSSKVGDFKWEKFTEFKNDRLIFDKDMSLFLNQDRDKSSSTFYSLFAGAGKTYSICKIVDNIINSGETYIILSPTHKALSEFRNLGYNCNVLCSFNDKQYRELTNYQNIIIDEMSMISFSLWNKIFNSIMNGKRFHLYGDMAQLPAISSVHDNLYGEAIVPNKYGMFNENFLGYLFNISDINPYEYQNRRNDFTWEYYNDIKSGKINGADEVLKHSSKVYDAEYVITYRKKTRDAYNKLLMTHHGHKSIFSKGCRVIVNGTEHKDSRKNNNLKSRGIYNSMIYVVSEIEDDYCKIKHISSDNYFDVSKKELEKYFIAGYSCNIHKVQGDNLQSYHFPEDDIFFLTKHPLRNILSYVIVSRIKTK